MSVGLHAPHDASGAEFGDLDGSRIVRHYGEPGAEYSAVRGAAGWVERGDLTLLRLWGRDPVRMLQGLITNDLAGASEGHAVYGAMLTPKGRVITDLRALRRDAAEGPEVLVEVPTAALTALRDQFRKFLPPLFARWEELAASTAAIGLYGPRSAELLSRISAHPVAALQEDDVVTVSFADQPVVALGTRLAGGETGLDLWVPVEAIRSLWDALLAAGEALGARPVGFDALETLRIEAGRPRFGRELTDRTIPTEAYESSGLMERAISFTKGCYTGQEVIVRIAHRGHVNRHLRGLLLGDAPPPPENTSLFHPESSKEVGWTTSAVVSPLLNQTIALGYVRREVAPGGGVRVASPSGPEAIVSELPFIADSGTA